VRASGLRYRAASFTWCTRDSASQSAGGSTPCTPSSTRRELLWLSIKLGRVISILPVMQNLSAYFEHASRRVTTRCAVDHRARGPRSLLLGPGEFDVEQDLVYCTATKCRTTVGLSRVLVWGQRVPTVPLAIAYVERLSSDRLVRTVEPCIRPAEVSAERRD